MYISRHPINIKLLLQFQYYKNGINSDEILNVLTIPLLGNRSVNTSQQQLRNNREPVFYGVRAEELPWKQLTLKESVEGSPVERQPARNGSGMISLAKCRYQEKSSEDTAEKLQIVDRTNVWVTGNYNVCKSAISLCCLYLTVIKGGCDRDANKSSHLVILVTRTTLHGTKWILIKRNSTVWGELLVYTAW
jgi:hypothetical protein